jgi:hypothetical protein
VKLVVCFGNHCPNHGVSGGTGTLADLGGEIQERRDNANCPKKLGGGSDRFPVHKYLE